MQFCLGLQKLGQFFPRLIRCCRFAQKKEDGQQPGKGQKEEEGADSWLLAAIEGGVPGVAWWLLLGNLFWVLAYDTEYAMVDRDDDLRIGMKTSAITLGRFDVAAVVVFYALSLAILALALVPLALGAPFYIALGLAALQAARHWWLIRDRSRDGCFRAFRENHWLGFTLFAGVVAGFALR